MILPGPLGERTRGGDSGGQPRDWACGRIFVLVVIDSHFIRSCHRKYSSTKHGHGGGGGGGGDIMHILIGGAPSSTTQPCSYATLPISF